MRSTATRTTHQQHIESATKKAEQNLELINKLQLALLALEIKKGSHVH